MIRNCAGSILSAVLFLCITSPLVADTIYLKSGEEEKGIVVENYHDRIVLSTISGEKDIEKKAIKDILYDRREQNLVKLGDFHEQKGNIVKAYEYFKKAYQLNPDYKEAHDKFIHARSVLLRRPEKQLSNDMDRKRALFKESGKMYQPSAKKEPSDTKEKKFKSMTGLVLISADEMPEVETVIGGSPADKAGVEKGDVIFMVWGRLTGYSGLKTIIDTIIDNPSPEIMLSIRRSITIQGPKKGRTISDADAGFSMDIEEAGLIVIDVKARSSASKEGLVSGDNIITIDGQSTRYMPLKDARELIDKSLLGGKVELDIIKDLILWKKD